MDDAPVTRPRPTANTASPPTPPTPPSRASSAGDYAHCAATQPGRPRISSGTRWPRRRFSRERRDFSVVPARRDRDMHPCANCHRWVQSNPEPRKLTRRMTTSSCSTGCTARAVSGVSPAMTKKTDELKTFEGEPVEYATPTSCAPSAMRSRAVTGCMVPMANASATGTGKREVYNCTACHYQHRPAIRAARATARSRDARRPAAPRSLGGRP